MEKRSECTKSFCLFLLPVYLLAPFLTHTLDLATITRICVFLSAAYLPSRRESGVLVDCETVAHQVARSKGQCAWDYLLSNQSSADPKVNLGRNRKISEY